MERPSILGIGACVVVAIVGIQWARGALDTEPQPCIQVPASARQDAAGYWWAGTIGPYGWSRPGSDRCVVAVPATRPLVGAQGASRPGERHSGTNPGRWL